MQDTHVIVLAGGKGTRMKSELPKVLVQLKGQTLLHHLLSSVHLVTQKPTIIVGYKKDDIIKATNNEYHYVHQQEQLGTGHAVMVAREELQNKPYKNIIVLPGDHPLVSPTTLHQLIEARTKSQAPIAVAAITVPHFDAPFEDLKAYGRIISGNDNTVSEIVENKDATDAQREIKLLNTAYFCFDAAWLWKNLDTIKNNNKSNEYYLTDLVGIATAQDHKIPLVTVPNPYEGMGINTREHLEKVEQYITNAEAVAA